MKLCTIVGARPQFIKAAAFSRIAKANDQIEEVIVHTGQHYDADMSDCFFSELSIPKPKYNLNIGSGLHGKQTGDMLIEIEQVLLKEKPDYVLVYGDTNSTLAGSLAAAKLHIPVAHVEAGLRSFNRMMPEEINRITADHLSSVLFAPTETGYQQLHKEGISAEKIHNVGDVMLDATLFYNEFNTQRKTIVNELDLETQEFILTTIHRAENTDCEIRLNNICSALIELAQDVQIIMPLHPRTRKSLEQLNLFEKISTALTLISPVGYLDMLALEKDAKAIVTDSGGVQKEAYFNKVPCFTLRDETEWIELVDGGWNVLCSPSSRFSLKEKLHDISQYQSKQYENLYGRGDASEKILQILTS